MKFAFNPALLLLTTLMLAGCSSSFTPTAEVANSAPSSSFTAEIPLSDLASVLASGAVLLNENAEIGVARVGLTEAQALAYNSRLRVQSGKTLKAEKNAGQFAGGGLTATMSGTARAIWAGGGLAAWTGGTARAIWAGGTYSPVPENTTTFQQIKLLTAQQLAPLLGVGVKVAIIDTGMDVWHPAFTGMLAPANEWKDYVDGDSLPQEVGTLGVGGFGHGTAVASLVAQVAPRIILLPIRVLGPDGSGDTVNVAAGLDYAVSKGAKVINLSLGSTERSDIVQSAIKRANDKGVFVVASAGNQNLPQLTYPAADMNSKSTDTFMVSVGSVSSSDRKSSFSNYSKVLEICAPGENMYSAAPGGMKVAWSGTSMAAPLVSGGLALALGQQLLVAPKELASTLLSTGADVYNDDLNEAYKNMLGQKGRIDLEQFLGKSLSK